MTAPNVARFGMIPEELAFDQRVGHVAFRIYGALATFADKDGRCWPAQGTIAERLGCSRQAVGAAIAALTATGWLTIEPRFNEHGARQTNVYRLHRAPTMQPHVASLQAQVAAPATPALQGLQPGLVIPCNLGLSENRSKEQIQGTRPKEHTRRVGMRRPRSAPPPDQEPGAVAPEKKAASTDRPSNPIWDALAEGLGYAPASDADRRQFGKAARDLAAHYSPAQIQEACDRYREDWPDMSLTLGALEKHIARLLNAPRPIRRGARANNRYLSAEDLAGQAIAEYEAEQRGERRSPAGAADVIEGTFREGGRHG